MDDKKEFPIALVSLFSLDFGIRHISYFLKEKGYPFFIIHFNRLRFTVELLGNDYFTSHLLEQDVCPEEDLKPLINLFKKLKPRIIGICVSSVTMRTVKRITFKIKRNLEILVVRGGTRAIIFPE